jgi:uncharacterized protein (DUF362 family)
MPKKLLHAWKTKIGRRQFLKISGAALISTFSLPYQLQAQASITNPLFWIVNIPSEPFRDSRRPHRHAGIDALLGAMASKGLMFYRGSATAAFSGPQGLIHPDDVVLIKVNAQWKYRGCTNSDVIRGLIQAILDHPGGFRGEVVIMENGQGRGSLNCDTGAAYGGDTSVQANANDPGHSFLYLVNTVFKDSRVSAFLLDSIASRFIGGNEHQVDGYRRFENVSYPCFTTAGGRRVELREGIWQGNAYSSNLKLINVPVLKHHDTGGSEITAALKHMYGVLSMADGQSPFRHYSGLGETCGKMMVSVRTPVLNLVDAIWVSHSSLTGYPENTTVRLNQLLAGQDPVALDYWAAKHLMYPIDQNSRHHPDYQGISQWLDAALQTINGRGGLANPEMGILVDQVTRTESEMQVVKRNALPDISPIVNFLLEG